MKKALCLSLMVACATTATAYAQSRSNYIPRTERGQLVANIVQRWSVAGAKKMGISPAGWAKTMGGAFGHASIEQLRKAVSAARLEDMIASLQTDGDVTAMEAGPASVYRHIAPCHAFGVDLASERTVTLDATQAIMCNIPATATGLVLKVVANDEQNSGVLTVWPADEVPPQSDGLYYQAGLASDHAVVVGATTFNIFNWAGMDYSGQVHVDVNIVGYFEVAPVARQNCTVTADAGSFAGDNANAFTLAPPACPSGSQQMAVFCRTTDRAARLRGSTASACVFEDAVPGDFKQGYVAAQARCCSVDN